MRPISAGLVTLKQQYDNVLLYVDEAHAVGVRGMHGLGCAEEQDWLTSIFYAELLQALASVGGYIVCSKTIRDSLIKNKRVHSDHNEAFSCQSAMDILYPGSIWTVSASGGKG